MPEDRFGAQKIVERLHARGVVDDTDVRFQGRRTDPRKFHRVEARVGLAGQHLGQRGLRGRHDERVAVERADLANVARGDLGRELLGHPDGAAGVAAADRLCEADDVGALGPQSIDVFRVPFSILRAGKVILAPAVRVIVE